MSGTTKKKKGIKWQIFGGLFITLLCLVPGLLNGLIERKVREALKDLPQGITVKFSDVHSNILSSSVALENLYLKSQPYTQIFNHDELYTKQILVNRIGWLGILLRKEYS